MIQHSYHRFPSFFRVAWVGIFLLCLLLVMTMSAGAQSVRLSADARSLVVQVPGIVTIDARWQVEFQRDGQSSVRLPAAESEVVGAQIQPTADGGQSATIADPGAGVELLFRHGRVGGDASSLWFEAGVRNIGSSPLRLTAVTPLLGMVRPNGPSKDWLLTGLHNRTPVIKGLAGLTVPESIHEYGTCYRADGMGYLFGPCGPPVGWLDFKWSNAENDTIQMAVDCPMDGVRVDPGETRWGQRVALVFGSPQDALTRWTDMIAKSHHARPQQRALTGWNNWNYLNKKDVVREVVDLVGAVRESNGQLRPDVIQMDYNYGDARIKKTLSAPWLKENLSLVAGTGAKYGIHIASSGFGWPGINTFDEFKTTLREAVAAGFSYFKVYYPPSNARAKEKSTAFEVYRRQLADLRAAVGEDVYLLYCNYQPDRAAVGFFDASRVGPDADREKIREAIPSVLRAFAMHGRWFTCDNDSYYTGTDIANISRIDGSWPLVRTWLSMTGLSCGSAITSDPLYWPDFKPYWRNVEVMTPPARERTTVLDLGTSTEWPRLIGHVKRDWADSTVALLWNPGTTERTVSLDFAQAGLDPKKRYAVWSFWDDRYLGVAQGSWTTPRLAPDASQHLVFTDLDRGTDRPVIIGSNLHIYCGAAEVKSVHSGRSSLDVELTDAGARDGSFYIYTRFQPILDSATGCTVDGITSAGENVWRVSLHDRRSGQAQQINMRILLPLTRQPWFWALIATVVLSLLFAAWRYVVGLRLERARGLDQERARIARDIHDELGASLTHIALLGELAQSNLHAPDRAEVHVDQIFRASQKLARSVDEIVWALNPANDTLAQFGAFSADFAQDFLQSAGITCRLVLPQDWPDLTLPPKIRHALFLVIKESLHNIVSHSGATAASLQISPEGNHLKITVTDNGCGFDPESGTLGRPGGGHGLANMRHRMQGIGGSLVIHSEPGLETVVIMEVQW